MTRLAILIALVFISDVAIAAEPTPALDALGARTVFEFPASSQTIEAGQRSSLQLAGTWQRTLTEWTGNDSLPKLSEQNWSGVMLPTANTLNAEPGFRQLLRTRVRIPEQLSTRSFHMRMPYFSGIESIWCDGVRLRSDVNHPWYFDFSSPLSANTPHEIVVVSKPNAIVSCPESPTLVATAPVYATQLFTKPDVAGQRLTIEVTLHNSTDSALSVELAANVFSMNREGQVYEREPALKLPTETVTLPAHGQATRSLAADWPRARQWWPDEPNQYQLRVETQTDNHADRTELTFAYRQWSLNEGVLYLNNVPYRLRTLRRSLSMEPKGEVTQRLHRWQAMGQNLLLYDGTTPWVGINVASTLEFLAAEGMPTARILPSDIMDAFQETLNIIRQERANSSIAVWVLDLPGSAADAEKTVEQVRSIDPTRPIIVRGQAVPDTLQWMSVTTPKQYDVVKASPTNKPGLLDLSTMPTVREQDAIDARRLGCPITLLGPHLSDTALSPIWQPVVALELEANGYDDLSQSLTRQVTIFNDSHAVQSINLFWLFQTRDTLPIQQRRGQENAKLKPSESKQIELSITLTDVEKLDRLPCDLVLSCQTDRRQRSIRQASVELFGPVAKLSGTFQLWDPHNSVRSLQSLVNVRRIDSVAQAVTGAEVLVVAPDAIDTVDARLWNQLLTSNRRIVVLHQINPLEVPKFSLQAHGEQQPIGRLQPCDPESILWNGLRASDLARWPIAEQTRQYRQPDTGVLRYISDGEMSPLIGLPSAEGVTLLCQLPLGKSMSHPVSRRLVRNLILLARDYHPADKTIVTPLQESHSWHMFANQERFDVVAVEDITTALSTRGIILLQANAATLEQLAELKPQVDAYMKAGGWIVLTELTPAGLSRFNTLVGEAHLIRDVADQSMIDNRPRNEGQLRLSDSALSLSRSPYRFVVSTDNLAPFLKGLEPTIRHTLRRGKPTWKGEWDRPQTIDTIAFRHPSGTRRILTMRLLLDGKASRTIRLGTTDDLQTFTIAKQTCRQITLQPIRWTDGPGDMLGIDDLRIPPATPTKATPWDKAGGIVAYPRGDGGFLLLQLQLDTKGRPFNEADQQCRVIRAILEQLGAKRTTLPNP